MNPPDRSGLTPAIRCAVHPSGWARIRTSAGERWVTKLPLVDIHTGLFAHPTHRAAKAVAEREGARLISVESIRALASLGYRIKPVTLPTPAMTPPRKPGEAEKAYQARIREPMASAEWCRIHDLAVLDQLRGWDGSRPVMNAGKWHRPGAPPGRMYLMGWVRDDGTWIQGESPAGSPGPHEEGHGDYATLCMLETDMIDPPSPPPEPGPPTMIELLYGAAKRLISTITTPRGSAMPRPTIRLGARGDHVRAWQTIIGTDPDGRFGKSTEQVTRRWQEARGLVADGVVGAKSWTVAGELPAVAPPKRGGGDPRAPACVAALRDANAAWPTRSRASDGIMGDLAHQFKPGPDGILGTADDVPNNSDHNLGNAFDLTHDPGAGVDCNLIAEQMITDPRISYVIWNAKIFNRARASEGWRAYKGNPHRHHAHGSVLASAREDASPWPWAPG